ncbi:hypothetical protein [Actinophytocola sp.]|uniref:hypothetical protein n=1 Tax=Actinophytocola sp. TaxID=1872138 RepID=UPI002D2E076B|nr:hypothetical protein [Actinophytocola sp.]HYQ69042.1 hypothetical protein [Actinophytocola sp.]
MTDEDPNLRDQIREAHRRAAAVEPTELVRGLADLLDFPPEDWLASNRTADEVDGQDSRAGSA